MLEHAAAGLLLEGTEDPLEPDRAKTLTGVGPPTVRAAVLRHLLTESDWAVDPKGVRLRRVRISGQLDLQAVTVRCPLVLDDCDLDDPRPVAVDFATLPLLVVTRCRLTSLSGDSVTVAGNLNIGNSVFAGPVMISGARIGGALLCGGARLGSDSRGSALICSGMNVRLSVHLSLGFTSAGAVVMPRAEIGGELICRGGHLGADNGGTSLSAQGVRVGGAVFFTSGFSAQGAIDLEGASVGGQLRGDGAQLGADATAASLRCDGVRTGGSIILDSTSEDGPFTTAGAVRLAGAEIAGSLTCRGARLGANRYGNALIADELQASVAVLLEEGFSATGAVRMPGAKIAGQLRVEGSRISGVDSDGYSLVGDGVKVGGPAHLDGLEAAGAVVLSGAEIGGLLSLVGARLGTSKAQHALSADGIRVGRDLLLRDGNYPGSIFLAGAVISGTLSCRRARLGADQSQNSLATGRMAVGGDAILDQLDAAGAAVITRTSVGGALSFRGARLGTNVYGNGLNADGIRVSRDVLLSRTQDPDQTAFRSSGTVRLVGAEISGSLHCQGASLDGNDSAGGALVAEGLRVGGSIRLEDQFTAGAALRLSHASIGGSLHCEGSRLGASSDQNALIAEQVNVAGGVFMHAGFKVTGIVSLRGASILRELRWEPADPPDAEVNLEGASAQYLTDDWTSPRIRGYWPSGRLRLAGFTYSGFSGRRQATVEQRLDWVRSQYSSWSMGSGRVPARGQLWTLGDPGLPTRMYQQATGRLREHFPKWRSFLRSPTNNSLTSTGRQGRKTRPGPSKLPCAETCASMEISASSANSSIGCWTLRLDTASKREERWPE